MLPHQKSPKGGQKGVVINSSLFTCPLIPHKVKMDTKYITSTHYAPTEEVLRVTQFDTSTTSLFLTEVVIDTTYVTDTRTEAYYTSLIHTLTETLTNATTAWHTSTAFFSVTKVLTGLLCLLLYVYYLVFYSYFLKWGCFLSLYCQT